MKKTWTLLLSMLLVLALGTGAFAADSDFKHMPDYFAAGKYSGSDTDIVVPASINGEATPILYSDSIGSSAEKRMITLTVSEGVTQLRDSNAYGAGALVKVSLPDTLEVIGRHNFYQADSLTEITIPASVAYMGQYCLSYCDNLTKVTFTGLCPQIGVNSFKESSADLVIYVPDDQLEAYKAELPEGLNIQPSGKKAIVSRAAVSESDFVFDAGTGTITGYTGRTGCFEIPATIGGVQVKSIGKEAFFKNPFIVMVTLPEGLETIELSAFAGAPALMRVNFPTTLKTIGNYAFNGAKLDELVLNEGLETIGDSAFTTAFGSHKISEIVIPNTVTTIGKEAFNANRAERIVIGENVQTIGNEAFASSGNLTQIVILNKNMISFAGDAFSKCTKDAVLTLAEGTSQAVYEEYKTLIPMLFPTCAVNEPAGMEMSFPALDVMAGMPFFGNWFSVAGKDVMGEFTDEYPVVTAGLNPDGSANVIVDGVNMPSAWYVTDGYAVIAPVENGKPNEANAYCYASLDENSRLVMDFGYAAAICEQEGKLYAAPAVPEKPWPEFDLENAKYFIGVWQTADGAMTLTLNDDGTATSAEMGEEAYELQWYADYGTAYVGPAMSELAEITFDGNGNIIMEQDGASILMKPYVEETPEPAQEAASGMPDISPILGHWDDGFKTLDIYEDGRIDLTYKSDGYVSKMAWGLVDFVPTVTEGLWEGAPIVIRNGLLIIELGNIYQEYERAGEAPQGAQIEYVPGTEDDFIGGWICEDDETLQILLLEGEANLIEGYDLYTTEWAVVDGVAEFDGMKLYIQEDWSGILDMGGELVRFNRGYVEKPKAPTAQPIGSEGEPYFGAWTADMGGMKILLTLNQDGTCAMEMFGESEAGIWTIEGGKAYVMGDEIYIDAEGQLVVPAADMIFTKGEGDDAGEEMSEEEQLLALLAALAAMEGNEGTSELPENLQPYVGIWHMVYLATGGLEGDLRTMGVTGKLELNADGTGRLSGAADDSGKWYDDEGQVRFGQAEAPLTLLEGGFLRYGSQLAGYMVFSQDEDAVWTPAAATAPQATAAPAAPQAPASAGFAGLEDRLNKKFVAKSYTSFGQTMDASMLGAEYAVFFRENGTCDFTLAGMVMQNLPWGLNEVAIGLSKQEAFVINYYGTMFNAVPTDYGFDMDYYGTMTLHFVLAE